MGENETCKYVIHIGDTVTENGATYTLASGIPPKPYNAAAYKKAYGNGIVIERKIAEAYSQGYREIELEHGEYALCAVRSGTQPNISLRASSIMIENLFDTRIDLGRSKFRVIYNSTQYNDYCVPKGSEAAWHVEVAPISLYNCDNVEICNAEIVGEVEDRMFSGGVSSAERNFEFSTAITIEERCANIDIHNIVFSSFMDNAITCGVHNYHANHQVSRTIGGWEINKTLYSGSVTQRIPESNQVHHLVSGLIKFNKPYTPTYGGDQWSSMRAHNNLTSIRGHEGMLELRAGGTSGGYCYEPYIDWPGSLVIYYYRLKSGKSGDSDSDYEFVTSTRRSITSDNFGYINISAYDAIRVAVYCDERTEEISRIVELLGTDGYCVYDKNKSVKSKSDISSVQYYVTFEPGMTSGNRDTSKDKYVYHAGTSGVEFDDEEQKWYYHKGGADEKECWVFNYNADAASDEHWLLDESLNPIPTSSSPIEKTALDTYISNLGGFGKVTYLSDYLKLSLKGVSNHNVHIHNCEIRDMHKGGISNMPSFTTIEDCTFFNGGKQCGLQIPVYDADGTRFCIDLEEVYSTNIVIRNNRFDNCAVALFSCCDNIEVSNNLVVGCEFGFSVRAGSNVNIFGNKVTGTEELLNVFSNKGFYRGGPHHITNVSIHDNFFSGGNLSLNSPEQERRYVNFNNNIFFLSGLNINSDGKVIYKFRDCKFLIKDHRLSASSDDDISTTTVNTRDLYIYDATFDNCTLTCSNMRRKVWIKNIEGLKFENASVFPFYNGNTLKGLHLDKNCRLSLYRENGSSNTTLVVKECTFDNTVRLLDSVRYIHTVIAYDCLFNSPDNAIGVYSEAVTSFKAYNCRFRCSKDKLFVQNHTSPELWQSNVNVTLQGCIFNYKT